MSAFNRFADTSSGAAHLQRAEQEEVCSDGDLGVPSPAPGVVTDALVQSREKRWHVRFPELRVTPPLASHGSLSGDTSTPYPAGRCPQFHRAPQFPEEGRSHQADAKHGRGRCSRGAGSVSSPAAPMRAWGHLLPLRRCLGLSQRQHWTRHPQRMEGKSQHRRDFTPEPPPRGRSMALGRAASRGTRRCHHLGERDPERDWLATGLTSLVASPLPRC